MSTIKNPLQYIEEIQDSQAELIYAAHRQIKRATRDMISDYDFTCFFALKVPHLGNHTEFWYYNPQDKEPVFIASLTIETISDYTSNANPLQMSILCSIKYTTIRSFVLDLRQADKMVERQRYMYKEMAHSIKCLKLYYEWLESDNWIPFPISHDFIKAIETASNNCAKEITNQLLKSFTGYLVSMNITQIERNNIPEVPNKTFKDAFDDITNIYQYWQL